MVDVPLMVHKPPQCDAPTPPRHHRRLYEGKQEMLLPLPLAMVVPKQKYLETSVLLSCWAHTNSVPELLRRVKTVDHKIAVKEPSIALAASLGWFPDLISGAAVGTKHDTAIGEVPCGVFTLSIHSCVAQWATGTWHRCLLRNRLELCSRSWKKKGGQK